MMSHCRSGYPQDRSELVSNGFDMRRFNRSPAARTSVRRELQVPPETPLIGKIGRFHPDKDHHTFLTAAARIASAHPEVRFLLAGRDVAWGNARLAEWATTLGLKDRCHFLGPRDDVPRLAAALDVGVSSSATEAFSNAIAEIMACGVPCVATDVGDSAYVVGRSGRIVPPQQPEALAAACVDLLRQSAEVRHELGRQARHRIATEFSLAEMVGRHYRIWDATATSSSSSRPSDEAAGRALPRRAA
jgi:glycosyltransferase involved in cell wall biosynthesis